MEFTGEVDKVARLEHLRERMVDEIQDYAIILLDADGTILSWNQGVEKIKGFTASEIIGQHFRIFYLPLARQDGLPEKLLDQARREGRAKHIGLRVRKDGSTFWGSIAITAVHDEDGEIIGFTKLTREITAHEYD